MTEHKFSQYVQFFGIHELLGIISVIACQSQLEQKDGLNLSSLS